MGATAITWIFFSSLWPSSAINKPWGEIDLTAIPAGEIKKYKIQGKPVIVVHATNEMIRDLQRIDNEVWDKNIYSNVSLQNGATYFIFYSISNLHGCGLKHIPKGGEIPYQEEWRWAGGFVDVFHDALYDYAGRAIRLGSNVPNVLSPSVVIMKGGIAKVVTSPLTSRSMQMLKSLPPDVARLFSAG